MFRKNRLALLLMACLLCIAASAQVGEYRNRFAVGVNGGYNLSTMDFQPQVTQKMHRGLTFGLVGRYTSEKYFNTICSVQLECNVAQTGWEEDIMTIDDEPVINPQSGVREEYKRTLTYVQIPVFAHLAWGKEQRGFNGFINLGPQIGFCLGEKTEKNYETPYTINQTDGRVNSIVEQETMPVENKFDYGIALGAGVEAHINHVGRFSLEGRYYYGLGNIYGDSKRDFFGRSALGIINIKLAYLFDI